MQQITDNIYLLVILAMVGTLILVISFGLLLFGNQNKLAEQREKLQMTEIQYQKDLLRSVIESQEAERRRIGQDLHDDVGTALANLRITIEQFAWQRYHHESVTNTAKVMIDRIMTDVRNISHKLSPEIMTIHTASEAIEELCYILGSTGNPVIYLTNEASAILDRFNLTIALVVYRVLEELLANTIKHAAASEVNILFTNENGKLIFDYRDNGIGMPAPATLKKGRGLQNIESRLSIIQASYVLYDNSGAGYHIHIIIPEPSI